MYEEDCEFVCVRLHTPIMCPALQTHNIPLQNQLVVQAMYLSVEQTVIGK